MVKSRKWTFLHEMATREQSAEFMEALLELLMGLDLAVVIDMFKVKDNDFQTVFHKAAKNKDTRVICVLLRFLFQHVKGERTLHGSSGEQVNRTIGRLIHLKMWQFWRCFLVHK